MAALMENPMFPNYLSLGLILSLFFLVVSIITGIVESDWFSKVLDVAKEIVLGIAELLFFLIKWLFTELPKYIWRAITWLCTHSLWSYVRKYARLLVSRIQLYLMRTRRFITGSVQAIIEDVSKFFR
ncbi:MAG: hypothetical protein IKP28_05690 [Clostridia bacterium]|nr:hypothetical protein [Clostridia bacterium]